MYIFSEMSDQFTWKSSLKTHSTIIVIVMGLLVVVDTTLDVRRNSFTEFLYQTSQLYECLKSHSNETLDDVNFYLYTRKNRLKPEKLSIHSKDNIVTNLKHSATDSKKDKNSSTIINTTKGNNHSHHGKREIPLFHPLNNSSPIKSTYFNVQASTKILVHGYSQTSVDEELLQIKGEYLARGEFNIILVDWTNLAASPCYPSAAAHTDWVGNCTGKLLAGLLSGGLDPNLVHIIGFSLGAHVAGYAGNDVSPLKVARITALDPALPLFAFVSANKRLDPSDAKFIDVIHTNGGMLGYAAPLGQADFFPNGGHTQPGCSMSDISCSHSRAVALYLESITSKVGFRSVSCKSYSEFQMNQCDRLKQKEFLGDPCSLHANGTYYLYTNDKKPFALVS